MKSSNKEVTRMPMPPMMNHEATDQYRVPKPKSLREAPAYVGQLIRDFTSRLAYIIRLVWEANRAVLFVMLLMAVFNGVMPVIGSLIGKEILNNLAANYDGDPGAFRIILGLLILNFVYLFVQSVVQRVYSSVIRISGELVSNHIKLKIMDKAKTVDVARFDDPAFYTKMENANREAGGRPLQVLSSTFEILSAVITIVSFVIVLFAVSVAAPFIIILAALPSTVINFIYRRKNTDYMFRRSKDRRQMMYYSDVIVDKDLVKEMRMFNLSDNFTNRYRQVFAGYFAGLKKLILNELFWNIAATVVTTVVNCVFFVIIARGVVAGDYEVGNYSLYTGALTSIASGIAVLISTTATIYEGTLFINNLIAFMQEERTVAPIIDPPRKVQRHAPHTIEFRDVSFRYPGTKKDVLKHINLRIEAGETVVLVGLNGAGKTTLIKLLTRLYDPTEGVILLDGYDIREYDVAAIYEMFGIIFQDFGKYAVSVRDNIAFGEVLKDIVPAEITDAARQSGANAFIDKLEHGYDTPLMRYFEENGVELSIGQWQKLAIARAFYSDSDILILDEPTASLDPLAEQEIYNQFDSLRKDKISIFVSHRLSSATVADKIVVLEYGEIAEIGNHRALMAQQGKYYELFTVQASRYQQTEAQA
ncbi:MAG: ABC transporter ATP-binding protein [Clostridia bacterium]|nr:ABC transporter ATP-binding protein [Clostridia bacterium]